MENMINKPSSSNKFIITGSDEEYEKYKDKAWNIAEQIENDIMEAENYIIEHGNTKFKMIDGSHESADEILEWLFGDSKDLATKANVEDSINWVMSCDIIQRFCKVNHNDMTLACEFTRCFGN